MKNIILSIFIFYLICGLKVYSQNSGDLSGLMKIRSDVTSRRISSFDVTGANDDRMTGIAPGEKKLLCDIKGTGIINHIWITIAPPPFNLNRNDIIFRIYYDGNTFPSVESPIGPFFGQGWNESYNYASLPLSATPVEGRGLVCYFKMPFRKGVKIEVENQANNNIDAFYYYIDYQEQSEIPADIGYFHAWYNHEVTKAKTNENYITTFFSGKEINTDGKNNYLFFETTGKGHYVGVNYYVNSSAPVWYGEGDDMIFIDGSSLPSIQGTGTEDYFNTSWCPKEPYSHPYFGYPRVNNNIGWLGRTHVYRYHIEDPIYFKKSIRFTIEHGHANNMTLDLASVAYWYQDAPAKLTPIPSKEERNPLPEIQDIDIYKWQYAWKEKSGNDVTLWGTEKEASKINPIKEWNVIGPFDCSSLEQGFATVFSPEKSFNIDEKATGKNNAVITWKQLNTNYSGYVDFNSKYYGIDNAVAYAHTYIWSPENTKVTMKGGSDDGIKVWVNKTVVLEKNLKRGANPDDDVIEIILNKGWNEVLVKNVEATGEWGFYLQLDDKVGKFKISREPK